MFISATINEITREIKWDKSQVAAVDGDYAVNGFKLTCLGLDPDYNLTTGTWYAVFTAQDGTSHSNPLTVSGGVVTWEFDNNINKGGAGVIKFFLYAVTTNTTGKILKRWDSAVTDLRVAGTIDYENQEEEAARESEIDRLAGLVTTLTATAATINDVKAVISRITNSSPVVVAAVADLSGLDTTKYQLAIVRADGYLYYYDGAAWQQGIKYGSYELDTTLTESGKAADAAAVGAEVSAIKEDLSSAKERITALEDSSTGGLTEEAKQALLACFAKVAWVDEHGQDYYDALEDALYPPVDLVRITAAYTQSGTVYDTDSLDSLKSNLVVTAHYTDGTSGIVTSYALSGVLAEGTSTIMVSYGGKSATFNVTVTGTSILIDGASLTWERGYISASGQIITSNAEPGTYSSNTFNLSAGKYYEVVLEDALVKRMAFFDSEGTFISRNLTETGEIPTGATYGRATITKTSLGVDGYDGTGTSIVLTM